MMGRVWVYIRQGNVIKFSESLNLPSETEVTMPFREFLQQSNETVQIHVPDL